MTMQAEPTLDDWKSRSIEAEARLAAIDASPAGSHHGDPILTKHDITLLGAFCDWVRVSNAARKSDGLPGYADWIKSRLFWRIRSGVKPLKYPPPTAYSCPWYEVIEVPGPHESVEPIRDREGTAYVAQCPYVVLGKTDDGRWQLGFGPYRFKAWNGPVTHRGIDGNGQPTEYTRTIGWIEYTGIDESASATPAKV